MERAANIVQRLQILRSGANLKESNTFNITQEIDNYNNSVGELQGQDCHICKNKGYLVEEEKLSIKNIELLSPETVSYNFKLKDK